MRIKAPDGFLVISDGHSGPHEYLPQADTDAATRAREAGIPLVKAGDTLDIIIYGWKVYQTAPCVESIKCQAEVQDVYLVAGNHDPYHLLRRLFRGSKVHVVKSLDINVNGRKWHIEHGDRFAVDWHHLGFLYSAVAFTMIRIAPKLWYRLMKPWRPGAMKPPTGYESEKYTALTDRIWNNARCDAAKHRRNNIIGHTHKATSRLPPGQNGDMFDDGDIRNDGSAVRVNYRGHGSIVWFGKKR